MFNLKYFILALLFNTCLLAQELKIEYLAGTRQRDSFVKVKENYQDDIKSQMEAYNKKLFDDASKILPTVKFQVVAGDKAAVFFYEEPMTIDGMSSYSLDFATSLAIDGEKIYNDLEKKKAYYIPKSTEIIRLVSSDEVSWQVTDQKKTILGMDCFKAIATIENKDAEYAGRIPIECWFSPELNFRAGPTPYINLPGAILELTMPAITFKAVKVKSGNFKIPDFNEENLKIMSHNEYVAYFKKWAKKHIQGRN